MTEPLFQLKDGQLRLLAATALAVAATVGLVVTHWTGSAAGLTALDDASARGRRQLWRGAAGAALLAAAVRVWVGAGPGDMAEAGRWDWLFTEVPQRTWGFATVPAALQLVQALGLPERLLYEMYGPAVSAAAAAATVALAARCGAAAPIAAASGIALALWPAHIVFGAGGAYTVWGGLGWTLLVLFLTDQRAARHWRVWGAVGWATLLSSARPEYRLAPLLALAGSVLLQWRRRDSLQLLLGLALLGHWSLTGPGDGAADPYHEAPALQLQWLAPLTWLLVRSQVAPVWVTALGLAGLSWVQPRRLGLMLFAIIGSLVAGYMLHKDGNPVFGPWRYLLSVLPLLLASAAAAATRLARVAWLAPLGEPLLAGWLALACLPYLPYWTSPTDLNAEFSAIVRTAPEVLGHADVVVIDDDNGDQHVGGEHKMRALLAMSLASGERWTAYAPGEHPAGALGMLGKHEVYGLGAWLTLPVRPQRPTAVWLGLAAGVQDRAQVQALANRPLLPGEPTPVWSVSATPGGWCEHLLFGEPAYQRCPLVVGWAEL